MKDESKTLISAFSHFLSSHHLNHVWIKEMELEYDGQSKLERYISVHCSGITNCNSSVYSERNHLACNLPHAELTLRETIKGHVSYLRSCLDQGLELELDGRTESERYISVHCSGIRNAIPPSILQENIQLAIFHMQN